MQYNFLNLSRMGLLGLAALCVACNPIEKPNEEPTNTEEEMPDWYYAGGKLGTTFLVTSNAFEQPTASVENANMMESFKAGEALFEKMFMSNAAGTRGGLGPVYVRSSCIHCHPNYGHGTSVPEGRYNTGEIGNGTLLVIADKTTDAYKTWVAGMPQLHAVAPFKAPIDESQITVTWKTATACAASGNVMAFPDGTPFELRYPEVDMPASAVYGHEQLDLGDYTVRLENTIGIYGTGLTDAIPDDSIIAQWAREEKAYQAGYLKHWNSAMFEGGVYKNWYTNKVQGDGTPYVRRYTYAMSRGPLLDAAGANAIWNITNVTRSDRRYHYLDLAGTTYATLSSQDPEVQAGFPAYIEKIDPQHEHAEWFTDDVAQNIYNYLTSKNLPVEMTDDEYSDLMIWHRGLAVPAVRGVKDEAVKRGREVFEQIGCAACHRPSWTTGSDRIQDPNKFFTRNNDMPRYPYQTIWPYTDFVQHKLCMENDIRTGWCRTTPLWGRGLHRKITGDAYEARMHDTRARDAVEAIMWHGYSEESDAYESTVKFYNLPKADRDAVVKFVNAI